MINRKQSVVDQTTKGINFLMEKNKIDVYQGVGSLKDSNHIKEKQHFIKLVSTILDFMQYSDGLNNIRETIKP